MAEQAYNIARKHQLEWFYHKIEIAADNGLFCIEVYWHQGHKLLEKILGDEFKYDWRNGNNCIISWAHCGYVPKPKDTLEQRIARLEKLIK